MSDNKNNGSGFLWGLVLGAAVGSLVSTQKGRRIIKELTEHGLDSLENIVNLEEIKSVLDDEAPVEPSRPTEAAAPPVVKKKPKLFRGIKR